MHAHAYAFTFFQALADELGLGAFVGTLAADSSNVVQLVETLYNVSHKRLYV